MAPWRLKATIASVLLLLGVLNQSPLSASDPISEPDELVVRYFVDVPVNSEEEVRLLAGEHFDIAGVNRESDLVGIVATVEELNRLSSLGYTYWIRDTSHPLRQKGPGLMALSDYTDPMEMSAFMDLVQANYPNLAQKVLVKDGLFEGHTIYAMKITKDVSQANERPTFVMDCQHHAREVMTGEIALDMIDYLTSRYGTDSQVKNWLDSIEIWVVPQVNPDGIAYVYSADNMWRKNRRPSCPVDLNRNYDFFWGACNGSTSGCSDDTNRGASAASEPETQGMKQLFSDVHALFGLSYHSYGQYLMYSYGCNDPAEISAMESIAQSLNSILIKDNGVAGGWYVGPIWSTIYNADGGSVDTQYGNHGTYAYVIEVNTGAFQPDYATWRNLTVQRQRAAWQFFLDKTLGAPQIRGKVTDALTGSPLQAAVSVQEVSYGNGEQPRRADKRGLYHWLAQAGTTYHLTFSMPGYCSETRTVSVGTGPYTLDISMSQPVAPSSASATGSGDNSIAIGWSPVSGSSEYRVLRGLFAGGPYTQIATVAPPQVSYQDTSVSGGVSYYYVVRSLENCESANSPEASSYTTGGCYLAPSFAGAKAVSNTASSTCTLDISWDAATNHCGGLTTYRIYRSTSPPFTPSGSNMVAAGLTGTSYTDHAALSNGSTYYYIVRSVSSESGAEDSNTAIASGIPTGPYTSGIWSDDAGDTGTAKMVLSSPWSVLSTGGNAAPKVYAIGTYTDNLCTAITTPVIMLGMGATLGFASKYDIETDWDAGIVEIATGPDFANWIKLTTVNYPDDLPNIGNACGFPSSGAGTTFSRSYATPTYTGGPYSGSLNAFNGQQVKLRWRFSSDTYTTGKGWWIDDISITNVMIPGTCGSGSASTPKEASPATSPMTCKKGETETAVEASFAPACGALDSAIYLGTGPITPALIWNTAFCSLGSTGKATFDPGDPSSGTWYYFVIVGQNTTAEGSYGQKFQGGSYSERPEATGLGTCDKGQVLTGACP